VFCAETVIFLLAGMLVGIDVISVKNRNFLFYLDKIYLFLKNKGIWCEAFRNI